MKKIFIIFICFFSLWVHQSDAMQLVACRPVVAGGGSCDDCSGNLAFAWHMENDDVTLGTPCGCSNNDTTATYISGAVLSTTQYKDGTKSLSFPTGSDNVTFTDAGDLTEFFQVSFAATYKFWIYLTGDQASYSIVDSTKDANDLVAIKTSGTAGSTDFILNFIEGGGINVTVTANSNCSLNTWYYVVAKVRSGATNPSMGIYVYSDEEVSLVASATSDTDLDKFNSGEAGDLRIGVNGTGAYGYIDKFELYKTWE